MFIAHLCCNGLVLLLFMLLVTLKMLTDKAGCYNVREKKLIVRQLTSTVNSSGIATFSVRGEGQRFFDSLKCMNTIFRGFQMTATVLPHLNDTLCSLSPRTGISVAQPAMSELGVPAKPGIGVSLSKSGTSNSTENR